jgi:hypothetical protein
MPAAAPCCAHILCTVLMLLEHAAGCLVDVLHCVTVLLDELVGIATFRALLAFQELLTILVQPEFGDDHL